MFFLPSVAAARAANDGVLAEAVNSADVLAVQAAVVPRLLRLVPLWDLTSGQEGEAVRGTFPEVTL